MSTPLTLTEGASYPTLVPPPAPPPSSGLNVNDLLFIFYRHKLKIGFFILVGCLAAAAIYFLMPAPYESTAKLLVRYVVERSTVDNVVTDKGEQGPVQQVGAPSEAILNSEVEILTSSDLALEVADTIGPARILGVPGSKTTVETKPTKPTKPTQASVELAAIAIRKSLEVAAVKDSNILSVTYRNKDPKLATEVLDLIVQRYLEKHLAVHRSAGTFAYVSKEAERMGSELAKTEAELKALKEKYGVTTIAETVTNNSAEITKTQTDLDATQSDLATQKVNLAEIDKFFHGQNMLSQGGGSSEVATTPPDSATSDHYANLLSQIDILRKAIGDLASRYAPGSPMLKPKTVQLASLQKEKQALEKKYPALLVTAVATGSVSGTAANTAAAGATEIILQRARLAGLETRENELKNRLVALRGRSLALGEVSPKIAELERTRDVQQASYLYYKQSLEKAQIDEGLNPSRMPNISVVQNPSPSVRSVRDLKKVLIGISAGSIVGGLALALFLELVVDRTVKRSRELEGRLHLPLMLAIPVLPGLNGERLRLTTGNEAAALDPSEEVDSGQLLRPFCESIRDRLDFYFGMNNMTHKPKLVAVTGLSKDAGVSSLASGLAAAFSDGEENKVLLVDKPTSPKRFYDMLASFKESKLDYIIFDMPAVGELTATLPMAGFMDKVLLVVEAEKSGREAVKKAYAALSAKTDVSVIFNKSRNYGPKWLEGEV